MGRVSCLEALPDNPNMLVAATCATDPRDSNGSQLVVYDVRMPGQHLQTIANATAAPRADAGRAGIAATTQQGDVPRKSAKEKRQQALKAANVDLDQSMAGHLKQLQLNCWQSIECSLMQLSAYHLWYRCCQ